MWRFDIKKEEYGPEEKLYLTRKKLKLSEEQWQVRTGDMTIHMVCVYVCTSYVHVCIHM